MDHSRRDEKHNTFFFLRGQGLVPNPKTAFSPFYLYGSLP